MRLSVGVVLRSRILAQPYEIDRIVCGLTIFVCGAVLNEERDCEWVVAVQELGGLIGNVEEKIWSLGLTIDIEARAEEFAVRICLYQVRRVPRVLYELLDKIVV